MEVLVRRFFKRRHFSTIAMSWQTSSNLNLAPWHFYFQLLLLQPQPRSNQIERARDRPWGSLTHTPYIQVYDQDYCETLDKSLTRTLINSKKTGDPKCPPIHLPRGSLDQGWATAGPFPGHALVLFPHSHCHHVFSPDQNARTFYGKKIGGRTYLCCGRIHPDQGTRNCIGYSLPNLNLELISNVRSEIISLHEIMIRK